MAAETPRCACMNRLNGAYQHVRHPNQSGKPTLEDVTPARQVLIEEDWDLEDLDVDEDMDDYHQHVRSASRSNTRQGQHNIEALSTNAAGYSRLSSEDASSTIAYVRSMTITRQEFEALPLTIQRKVRPVCCSLSFFCLFFFCICFPYCFLRIMSGLCFRCWSFGLSPLHCFSRHPHLVAENLRAGNLGAWLRLCTNVVWTNLPMTYPFHVSPWATGVPSRHSSTMAESSRAKIERTHVRTNTQPQTVANESQLLERSGISRVSYHQVMDSLGIIGPLRSPCSYCPAMTSHYAAPRRAPSPSAVNFLGDTQSTSLNEGFDV